MMEKELNKQHMDELIQAWTEERLTPETDSRLTESLLDFIENDDSEIDVNDLLDLHIHELAEEELMTRHRKWKTLVASVAAASVVLIMAAIAFLTTREHGHHTDTETFANPNFHVGYHSRAHRNIGAEPYFFSDSNGNEQIGAEKISRTNQRGTDAPQNLTKKNEKMDISPETVTKEMAKAGSNSGHKKFPSERAMKQEEETAAVILTETLAEINAGLLSMADNTKECLSMTNASMLPASLTSDDNETNIIETNLINALYEIRNLNIELNFNTDNKTTEI